MAFMSGSAACQPGESPSYRPEGAGMTEERLRSRVRHLREIHWRCPVRARPHGRITRQRVARGAAATAVGRCTHCTEHTTMRGTPFPGHRQICGTCRRLPAADTHASLLSAVWPAVRAGSERVFRRSRRSHPNGALCVLDSQRQRSSARHRGKVWTTARRSFGQKRELCPGETKRAATGGRGEPAATGQHGWHAGCWNPRRVWTTTWKETSSSHTPPESVGTTKRKNGGVQRIPPEWLNRRSRIPAGRAGTSAIPGTGRVSSDDVEAVPVSSAIRASPPRAHTCSGSRRYRLRHCERLLGRMIKFYTFAAAPRKAASNTSIPAAEAALPPITLPAHSASAHPMTDCQD